MRGFRAGHYGGKITAAKKRKAQNRLLILNLKQAPCFDCGGRFHPDVMDFDHVRGSKTDNISNMVSRSREALETELAKCQLVCANCHRLRTNRRSRKTPSGARFDQHNHFDLVCQVDEHW